VRQRVFVGAFHAPQPEPRHIQSARTGPKGRAGIACGIGFVSAIACRVD